MEQGTYLVGIIFLDADNVKRLKKCVHPMKFKTPARVLTAFNYYNVVIRSYRGKQIDFG